MQKPRRYISDRRLTNGAIRATKCDCSAPPRGGWELIAMCMIREFACFSAHEARPAGGQRLEARF